MGYPDGWSECKEMERSRVLGMSGWGTARKWLGNPKVQKGPPKVFLREESGCPWIQYQSQAWAVVA